VQQWIEWNILCRHIHGMDGNDRYNWALAHMDILENYPLFCPSAEADGKE